MKTFFTSTNGLLAIALLMCGVGVSVAQQASVPVQLPQGDRHAAEKQPAPAERIIGKWETKRNDEIIALELFADGTASFWEDGEKAPGKGAYKLDASKTPFALDLSLDDENTRTICEFTEDGGLRIAEPQQDRPKDFKQGDTLVFKRVKK